MQSRGELMLASAIEETAAQALTNANVSDLQCYRIEACDVGLGA